MVVDVETGVTVIEALAAVETAAETVVDVDVEDVVERRRRKPGSPSPSLDVL